MNQPTIRLFLIVILISFFQTFHTNAQRTWQAKVSPTVFNSLKEHNSASFIVVMKQQADLSAVRNIHGKDAKGNFVYETLSTLAKNSQQEMISALKNDHVVYQSFWIVNAIAVSGNASLVQQLAMRADVKQILNNSAMGLNKPVSMQTTNERDLTIPWGVDSIHAPAVWDMGIQGAGVVIGGQDTGYDWEHPALKNQYRGWNGTNADHNYNWHDNIHAPDPHNYGYPNPCGLDIKAPCDDYGHGTHTMGTMVGGVDSIEIGIAPEAKWIGERNMEQGWGNLASYMEGFQWFIAPTDTDNLNADPSKAPHVINDSWVCVGDEGCDPGNFSLLEDVVNNTKAAGIVVVASAGNDGPYCNTIFYPPAMYEASFSTGAIDANMTIAGFSSRGNVMANNSGIMKPNVAAPGVDVLSSIPGNQYAFFSGTSMAGPHTVGTVALLICSNPALAGEVDQIENIIESTARPVTTNEGCGGDGATAVPNNTYGWGIIDALAAVQKAQLSLPSQILSNNGSANVFPSVTRDAVYVNLEAEPQHARLEIFSMEGKRIGSNRLEAQRNVIHLSDLACGMYLYRVVDGMILQCGKLVKQ
jgi:subtilisin family serine protease